jgi:hypothetical protein
MRALDVARFAVAFSFLIPAAHVSGANAADPPRDIKGLYLMTDYPAITVRPGTTSNIPLRLQNYGLGPEEYKLSVAGVPSGWTATILGGGQPVAAAMPAPDASVSLQLRLDVPKNADLSAQTLTVKAEGQGTSQGSNQASLPLAVSLAKELPAKLTVTTKLPELRGSPKSNFEYTLPSRTIPAAISPRVLQRKRRTISRPPSRKPMARRSCPRSRSRPANPRTSKSR